MFKLIRVVRALFFRTDNLKSVDENLTPYSALFSLIKVEQMKDSIKILPFIFFKDEANYIALTNALKRQKDKFERYQGSKEGNSGREMPDILTQIMSEIYSKHLLQCFHVLHWHQMSDSEGRSIRNQLSGRKCRNPDLMQYESICLQHVDSIYSDYVQRWCETKNECLDEDDDD